MPVTGARPRPRPPRSCLWPGFSQDAGWGCSESSRTAKPALWKLTRALSLTPSPPRPRLTLQRVDRTDAAGRWARPREGVPGGLQSGETGPTCAALAAVQSAASPAAAAAGPAVALGAQAPLSLRAPRLGFQLPPSARLTPTGAAASTLPHGPAPLPPLPLPALSPALIGGAQLPGGSGLVRAAACSRLALAGARKRCGQGCG